MKIDLMRRLAIALSCFATVGFCGYLVVSADESIPIVAGDKAEFNPFASRVLPRPAEPTSSALPLAPVESNAVAPLPTRAAQTIGMPRAPIAPPANTPSIQPLPRSLPTSQATPQFAPQTAPTALPVPVVRSNNVPARIEPLPNVSTRREEIIASAVPATRPAQPPIIQTPSAPRSESTVVVAPGVRSASVASPAPSSAPVLMSAPRVEPLPTPARVVIATPVPVNPAPMNPAPVTSAANGSISLAGSSALPLSVSQHSISQLPPIVQTPSLNPEIRIEPLRTAVPEPVIRASQLPVSYDNSSSVISPATFTPPADDSRSIRSTGSSERIPDRASERGVVRADNSTPYISPSPSDRVPARSIASPATEFRYGGQEDMGEVIVDETMMVEGMPFEGEVYDGAILEGGEPSIMHGAGFPADCCRGCPERTYAIAEAIYFRRESQGTLLNVGMPNASFSHELGGRVTVGRRGDCLDGWEATYMTTADPWSGNAIRTGAGLNTQMVAAGGLGAANISAFNGANFQQLFTTSRMHSFEVNQMTWGFDVLTTFYGLRYIQLDDSLRYTSVAGANTGNLLINTENHLFGPQIGSEWFYDIGGRVYLSGKGKLGAFANANSQNATLTNTGPVATAISGSDSGAEFAALGELQFNAFYKLTQNTRLRAGYEVWYLYGVATSNEQYRGTVTPLLGRTTDDNDDIFFHGASVGFEWVR